MSSSGGFLFKGSIFSHDAKLVLSPSGCRLKIHSALTCELACVLEGHEADLTTIALNPKQPGQVYSASKDGTIKLWDYKTAECLATLPIRETVRSMVRPYNHKYTCLRHGMQTLVDLGGDVPPYLFFRCSAGTFR